MSILNNRYELHDKLGEGGMGTVYRATDRFTGEAVALKRLRLKSQGMFLDFDNTNTGLSLIREFQTLASLHHPHIIRVQDFGFIKNRQPFFTMSFLENARTLTEAAAQYTAIIPRIQLLLQTFQALAYVHRRSIIHRDIKPGNVLVNQSGQVNVLDFGLVDAPEEATGTLAYMPPEAIRGEKITPAADLYAAGIMAYQMFTGCHPFDISSITQLINDITNRLPDLTPLFDLTPESAPASPDSVPLHSIISKLLEKSPSARYQTAYEVIQDLSHFIGQPLPEESDDIRESYLQAAHFVGRNDELAQLTHALKQAVQGKPGIWLIGGESGVGKSRLIEEIRIRALVEGIQVIRGQGVQDGYHILYEPIRRLALLSAQAKFQTSVLKKIVPDIAGDTDPATTKSEFGLPTLKGEGGQQLAHTFIELLQQQNQPILLILEDLHQALNSLPLLKHLATGLISQTLPVLILITYRDDELPDALLQFENADIQRLKLARLSSGAIAQLSTAMLGEKGAQSEIIQFLQKETEGNAFFMVEIVRELAREFGQLNAIDSRALPAGILTSGIKQFLLRRLKHTPARLHPLLKAAAIAGRRIDSALLSHIAPDIPLERWLYTFGNAAILDVYDGQWRFAHEKLREALLNDIAENETTYRDLHRQVAQAIEQVYPDDDLQAGRLAHLWQVAGNPQKERHYARLAAEQAMQFSAFRQAITFYERVIKLTETASEHIPLYIKIGEIYYHLGDYARARQYLEPAVRRATVPSEKARALCELSAVLFEILEYQQAEGLLLEALSLVIALPAEHQDSNLLSKILFWLSAVYIHIGQPDKARTYATRSLRVATSPHSRLLPLNALSIIAVFEKKYDPALNSLQQVYDLAREIGDRMWMAISIGNVGEINKLMGNYPEAQRATQEALDIIQTVGAVDLRSSNWINMAEILTHLDDIDHARKHIHKGLSLAHQWHLKHQKVQAILAYARYQIARQNPDEALAMIGMLQHNPSLLDTESKSYIADLLNSLPEMDTAPGLVKGHSLDFEQVANRILMELSDETTANQS